MLTIFLGRLCFVLSSSSLKVVSGFNLAWLAWSRFVDLTSFGNLSGNGYELEEKYLKMPFNSHPSTLNVQYE